MAKKRTPPEATPIEATQERAKDRHRPRKTIALSPELYEALAALAERHNRPLLWQARLLLQNALKAEGLWPPGDARTSDE